MMQLLGNAERTAVKATGGTLAAFIGSLTAENIKSWTPFVIGTAIGIASLISIYLDIRRKLRVERESTKGEKHP